MMLVYDAIERCGKENTHWNWLPARRLIFPEYGRIVYIAANHRELEYINGLIPADLAMKSITLGEGSETVRHWHGDVARQVAAIIVRERQPNEIHN